MPDRSGGARTPACRVDTPVDTGFRRFHTNVDTARSSARATTLYALITLMVVLWSGNYVVAKIALREFPPLLLSGLRVTLAGLIMIPLYLWKGGGAWSRSDVPVLLCLGILGVTLNQLFFVLGISRTTVAHSSILIGTTPVLVLLTAVVLKMERITFRKIGGMALALAGVTILQAFRLSETGPTVLGDFFVFLAALTFALFTVIGKRVSLQHDSITVNTFAYIGGALALSPMTLWQAHRVSLASISPAAWASVAYMALFPSVLCYLIYYYALRRISASRVSAFSYLQPLVAILMAVPILGEHVAWPVIAGGIIIFAGVFLTEHS